MSELLNKDQAFNEVQKASELEVITVYSPCGEILCTKWLDHIKDENLQKSSATAFIAVVKDNFLFTIE